MSFPPEPAASQRRCTVAGQRRNDGAPMSIVCEQLGSDGPVVLYPHGIQAHGVVLNVEHQRTLARWLLEREATPRRC